MLTSIDVYFQKAFSEQLASGINNQILLKEAAVTFKTAPAWIEPSSYTACTENTKLEFEDASSCSLANQETLTKKLVVAGAIEALTSSPTQPHTSNGFCEIKACPTLQDSAANTLALTSTVVEIAGTVLVVLIFFYYRRVKGVDLHKILRQADEASEIDMTKLNDDVHEVVDNPMSSTSAGEFNALKSEFKKMQARSEKSDGEFKMLQAKSEKSESELKKLQKKLLELEKKL